MKGSGSAYVAAVTIVTYVVVAAHQRDVGCTERCTVIGTVTVHTTLGTAVPAD